MFSRMKFHVCQNPDRGLTVVDFSLMLGLLAIVVIVAVVALGVLGSN